MKNKYRKSKKWFIRVRGSYLPNNNKGWLTYIPFTSYLVVAPWIAIVNTDNLAVAVLITVPNWIAAAIVMTYLATQKS